MTFASVSRRRIPFHMERSTKRDTPASTGRIAARIPDRYNFFQMTSVNYDYLFLGGLRQDYCITHDEVVHLGIMGGNAIYAAVGARIWSASVGLVSRVGSNFPQMWLKLLEEYGFDTQGIRTLEEPMDTRTFYAYITPEERVDTNPTVHFLAVNHPLPKELIDYRSSTEGQDARETYTPLAIRPDDIPPAAADARGAHLAPADFLTHITVPIRLRELGVHLLTLDPSVRYMEPTFVRELPVIVNGLDAFLPNEKAARAFFAPQQLDVVEIAAAFGDMGSRFVVLKQGARGQIVWEQDAQRCWHVPAYAATRLKDTTGTGDAFCGGFLVGLDQTGDVVEATLRGTVSASLTAEGSGATYALDVTPGLAEARLDALRPAVKRM